MRLIAAFLVGLLCFAQGAQADSSRLRLRYASGYSIEAARYFAQQAINGCALGTAAWRKSVDDLVRAMKAHGNWPSATAGYDGLWLGVTPDTCTLRINLVFPAIMNLTISGTPTFTAYQSVCGNGTDAMLSTGVNWSAMVRFQQDDAGLFVWKQANGGGAQSGTLGYVASLGIRHDVGIGTGNNTTTRINTTTNVSGTGAALANMRFSASRTSSTSTDTYRNGAVLNSGAAGVSTARPANVAVVFNQNALFSSACLSLFGFGSSRDAAHQLSQYQDERAFLLANGVPGVV